MSDTKNNLLHEDGWVKRTQNVNGVEIHYVENINTNEVIDFKFKD
ncbi:MafB [Vibrio navarrensis]|nr:MafB [Vibrio navarrensis]MBE4615437.1 MafB [Vibrio navarrensis]